MVLLMGDCRRGLTLERNGEPLGDTLQKTALARVEGALGGELGDQAGLVSGSHSLSPGVRQVKSKADPT